MKKVFFASRWGISRQMRKYGVPPVHPFYYFKENGVIIYVCLEESIEAMAAKIMKRARNQKSSMAGIKEYIEETKKRHYDAIPPYCAKIFETLKANNNKLITQVFLIFDFETPTASIKWIYPGNTVIISITENVFESEGMKPEMDARLQSINHTIRHELEHIFINLKTRSEALKKSEDGITVSTQKLNNDEIKLAEALESNLSKLARLTSEMSESILGQNVGRLGQDSLKSMAVIQRIGAFESAVKRMHPFVLKNLIEDIVIEHNLYVLKESNIQPMLLSLQKKEEKAKEFSSDASAFALLACFPFLAIWFYNETKLARIAALNYVRICRKLKDKKMRQMFIDLYKALGKARNHASFEKQISPEILENFRRKYIVLSSEILTSLDHHIGKNFEVILKSAEKYIPNNVQLISSLRQTTNEYLSKGA